MVASGRADRLPLSDDEFKVIGTEYATVTELPGLAATDKLHKAGGISTWAIKFDSQRDTFLATDAVTIGGCDVPDSERDALQHFLYGEAAFAVWHLGLHQACLLGYEA